MCTHDPNHAPWFGDDAIALEHGGRSSTGTVEDVVDADRVERLYGFASEIGEFGGRPVVVPQVRGTRIAAPRVHAKSLTASD